MNISNMASALKASNSLNDIKAKNSETMKKISSGRKINKAADDASGLAITNKFNSQIRGYNVAIAEAQNTISMTQVAEGAMQSVQEDLQRIRELAVQAASDVYTDDDRRAMQYEVDQLVDQIRMTATNTEFNTKKLLDGSLSTSDVSVPIGANSGQTMKINIGSMMPQDLKIAGGSDNQGRVIDLMSSVGASNAIKIVDDALNKVSSERGSIGAIQKGLESSIEGMKTSSENLMAADSAMGDTDIAEAAMEMSMQKILEEANYAMLAHQIKNNNLVLKLLNNGK